MENSDLKPYCSLFIVDCCHSLVPRSSTVWDRVPFAWGCTQVYFPIHFCTFGGWLIGLWSPTLFSLWNHTNSILHYFQPSCFSHLSLLLFVWKFSGLWLACLCIGSCLSWWRTPGNRCHWPGLSRFVGSGYALVGCLWAADSFPHFLVLVGSSYVGSILNGTKL